MISGPVQLFVLLLSSAENVKMFIEWELRITRKKAGVINHK